MLYFTRWKVVAILLTVFAVLRVRGPQFPADQNGG